jgi:hypothetical protein
MIGKQIKKVKVSIQVSIQIDNNPAGKQIKFSDDGIYAII